MKKDTKELELFWVEIDGKKQAVVPVASFNPGFDPEQGKDITVVPENKDFQVSERWYPWGGDNFFPESVRLKLEQSTIAMSAIYKLVSLMNGRLIYYRELDDKGNPIELDIPEVETFMKRNYIKKYFLSQFVDYRFFMNTFPELILGKDKKKIVRLVHQDASFARLSRQNPKSLQIEFVAYSANWPCPLSEDIRWVPLMNPSNPEEFINKLRGHKFSWWCHFPSPGRTYYKYPFWGGLFRKDGWLDVANNTPTIISNIHRNQIVVKYHIRIPETYWKLQYPDWDTYTSEKKQDLYSKKVSDMNSFLSDKSNAGKSFTTVFGVNPVNGEALPDWEIVAIDDKAKKDQYIPNSQAADSQIVQALGLDPSLMGLQPEGGKMGAGSGTDKRVSFINALTMNTMEQQIILEPLQFIADFNGDEWEGLNFAFSHIVPGRLDQNPSGTLQMV